MMPCPLCESLDIEFYFQANDAFKQEYNQCLNCDLVFVTKKTRLSREEESLRYNNHHNNEDDKNYQNFLNRLAKPMLKLIPDNSNGLDFGSGNSETLANIFKKENHLCESFDIFYKNNPKLLQNKYNFISASEVFEHLNNPQKELKTLIPLLNPKGFLGIMTTKLVKKDEFENWWYKNDPTHISLYSDKTFNYIASEFNLNIIHNKNNIIIFSK